MWMRIPGPSETARIYGRPTLRRRETLGPGKSIGALRQAQAQDLVQDGAADLILATMRAIDDDAIEVPWSLVLRNGAARTT